MRLFDFKCKNGHVTEELTPVDCKEIRCHCDETAHRVISPVVSHLPANAGFPGRDMQWVKDHEKHGNK